MNNAAVNNTLNTDKFNSNESDTTTLTSEIVKYRQNDADFLLCVNHAKAGDFGWIEQNFSRLYVVFHQTWQNIYRDSIQASVDVDVKQMKDDLLAAHIKLLEIFANELTEFGVFQVHFDKRSLDVVDEGTDASVIRHKISELTTIPELYLKITVYSPEVLQQTNK